TQGFGIFSDGEKLELIKRIAQKRGVIVLTDGDGAGFVIRNHLKGMLKDGTVKHAYIPDIYGKERRKRTYSKEGKLGVEGMERQVIIDSLKRAGAVFEEDTADYSAPPRNLITKSDLFELGLSGNQNSADRRKRLLKKLDLPEHLSANALIDILNILYSREELFELSF
ncbi:MAG: toprim domain-containing protein, partial [Oscillospiraceae bacterium]